MTCVTPDYTFLVERRRPKRRFVFPILAVLALVGFVAVTLIHKLDTSQDTAAESAQVVETVGK